METSSEVGRANLAQLYSGDASHEVYLMLKARQTVSIRCDNRPQLITLLTVAL